MKIFVGHAKLVTPAGATPPERGRPYAPGYLLSCLCGWARGIIDNRQSARDVYRAEHLASLRAAARTHCRVCAVEFTTDNRSSHVGICKTCERDRRTAWARANPERDRDLKRDSHLRRKYGIDAVVRQAMLDAQGGRCAICQRPFAGPDAKSRLFVDHDHVTGEVRGLLCFLCNTGLGAFRDNAESLRAAANYIEEKKCAR